MIRYKIRVSGVYIAASNLTAEREIKGSPTWIFNIYNWFSVLGSQKDMQTNMWKLKSVEWKTQNLSTIWILHLEVQIKYGNIKLTFLDHTDLMLTISAVVHSQLKGPLSSTASSLIWFLARVNWGFQKILSPIKTLTGKNIIPLSCILQ